MDSEGIRKLRLNEVYHLISSHSLGELSKVATHYGIIRNGRMIKEISADELSRECCDYMCVKTAQPERMLQYLQKHIRIDGGKVVDRTIHLFHTKDGAAVNQYMF